MKYRDGNLPNFVARQPDIHKEHGKVENAKRHVLH
jgi:hypothetical protein